MDTDLEAEKCGIFLRRGVWLSVGIVLSVIRLWGRSSNDKRIGLERRAAPGHRHYLWDVETMGGLNREGQDHTGWGEAGDGKASEVQETRKGRPGVGLEDRTDPTDRTWAQPVGGGAEGERQALGAGITASGQHAPKPFRSPHSSLAAAIPLERVRN